METPLFNILSIILSILTIGLTIIGLSLAYRELKHIRESRETQYDQLRREKTVEMIMYYSKNIPAKIKTIEKIVSSLSDEQCQDLYNSTAFAVTQGTKEKICEICPLRKRCLKSHTCMCKKDDKYMVDGEILYFFRGSVMSYLNTLESVLLSWQLGIVDQAIIEEQFAFLDKKRQRERALETYRTIAGGGHSYPAIEKFYLHLDQKRNERAHQTLKDIIK